MAATGDTRTRLVTGLGTQVVDNLDYLPFGEQIAGDTGTTHKFTEKERDGDSGLELFRGKVTTAPVQGR